MLTRGGIDEPRRGVLRQEVKTNWHDRYDSSEAEGDVASEDDDEEVAAKPAGE